MTSQPTWYRYGVASGDPSYCGSDGVCKAVTRTTVAGVEQAVFTDAYIKLKSHLSMEYLEMRGAHPVSGEKLVERLNP